VINNVIFDIGNVLLYYYPYEYLEKKYSYSDTVFLFSAIFDTDEWLKLDKGTITEEEALSTFIERNPEKENILREVMSDFYSIFTPIESSVEILKHLRNKGYTLLFLSNIHLGIYKYIIDKYDFFKEFNGGIISSKVKMLKPGKGIFFDLIKKYNIVPEESIFIDDTAHNIKTANKLGFVTIHLTDPADLKKELKVLGI
jgi:epoxide hydrolase-like predicted phosphatase